jgi:hypothetical protein
MTTDDEARRIDRYFALLQAQLDASPDDWPEVFTFPEPSGDIERRAFEAFLHKVRSAGLPVAPVTFIPRRSLN